MLLNTGLPHSPSHPRRSSAGSKIEKLASTLGSGIKDGISRIQALRGDKKADESYSHGLGSYGAPFGSAQQVSGGACGGSGGFNRGGGVYGGACGCGGVGGGGSFCPPATHQPAQPSTGGVHQRGRPGGGWDAPSAPLSPGKEAPLPAASPQVSVAIPAPQPVVAGEHEQRLVDELTAPGGVRASVPREELRKFCTTCQTLDSNAIAQLLQAKLEAPEWQRRLKAMSVIEALIKSEDTQVLDHFKRHVALVEAQLNSTQASIKDKAHKLLLLLGEEVAGGDASQQSVFSAVTKAVQLPSSAPPVVVSNLLHLEEDNTTPTAQLSEAVPVPVDPFTDAPPTEIRVDGDDGMGLVIATALRAEDGGGALFQQLQLVSASSGPETQLQPLANATLAPATVAPPTGPPTASIELSTDMFDGMQLEAASSPAPPPPVPTVDLLVGGAVECSSPSVSPSQTAPSVQGQAGLSALEQMLVATPAAPAVSTASPPKGSSGMMGGAMGGAMPATMMQQQQMAYMQQQMAMMQQQIVQQQQMLRMGAADAGMPPRSGLAPPTAMPFMTKVSSGNSIPINLSDGSDDGGGAFGFMGKSSDAFSFVGDEISKNKRDL